MVLCALIWASESRKIVSNGGEIESDKTVAFQFFPGFGGGGLGGGGGLVD